MPGNIVTQKTLRTKSWPFTSFVSGGAVTQYVGGFYLFGASNFVPAGGQNLGTANTSYATHVFVVLGEASVDMIVTVTGTSITDDGIRTPGAAIDIDTSGGVLNDYFETPEKFVGLVVFTLKSGTGKNVNYGFAKYWDNNNTNFTVKGLEVTGFSGASDATPQIQLHKHQNTNWTYNAGAPPTPPPALADIQTDHNTEFEFTIKESFAWKRTNLSTFIAGSGSQGVIFSIDINNNKSINVASLSINYTPE